MAETIAELGERVADAALDDKHLFAQLHLREEELRLVRLGKVAGPASTASRLDAFLLPDSLKFAEYNGESPAGAGYAETLAEIFRELPVMGKFAQTYRSLTAYPLSAKLLDALVMSYLDWGGLRQRPQIADYRLGDVPTWSEFEILKAALKKWACRRSLADPRDLRVRWQKTFTRKWQEDRSGLPSRADQRHRGQTRRMRRAGRGCVGERRLHGQSIFAARFRM